MLARMNRGSYWSGDCFFRAWGNGQAQRSSGACGSPVRPPLSPPDGLIGEVEAVADGSMVEAAGAAGAAG
jgi:hypothetical protein